MEERIAEDYKKNSENRTKNLLARINIVHLLILGVIVLIIFSISKNTTDPKYNYVIYAVLIGIILVLYFKPSKEKRLLPDYIAKEIAQEALNKKVRDGIEFPYDSKVYVTPYCHLVWKDSVFDGNGGYVHWDIGFEELVKGSQYKRSGVISIHCFDGIITGIKFMPFGFTGRETHDIKEIPVGVVMGNVKTTDMGQR